MNLGVWVFIAAILIVIMIHEGGHFLMAKAFGFKAPQYFLGFGPTVWSFKRGETEYGIKALPLGGFVKIVGMNPYEEIPPEDEPRAYFNKPRWQRALVIVAGSGTHFIVAFLILLGTAMLVGIPELAPRVSAVSSQVDGAPTPASAADIRKGDVILEVDGREVSEWSDVQSYIRQHPGERVVFLIERQEEELEVPVELGQAIVTEENEPLALATAGESLRPLQDGEELVGFFGVAPSVVQEPSGLLKGVQVAGRETWKVTTQSVKGIGDTFNMIFGGELWNALTGSGERELDEGPLGVVGAGRLASDSLENDDPLSLVALIVGFTVFVGIMNLLPLPPLDGGHLAVIAFEAVTRKTVDVRRLIPIAAAVISFFVILFLAVLYLDLARPIKSPF